jgi:hypothetical protein
MEKIAEWSADAIARRDDPAGLARIAREVSELARTFPVPGRDATMLAEEGSR